MPCSNCDGELRPDARYCSGCGTKVEPTKPTKLFCHECGEEQTLGTKFCDECGTDLKECKMVLAPALLTDLNCGPCKNAREEADTQTKKIPSSTDDTIPDQSEVVTSRLQHLDGFGEDNIKELRILLVGHTGHGKSETGNSLLGRKAFKTGRGHCSVTKTCQRLVVNRFGWQIEIVDTPGFFDTEHDDRFVNQELSKCVALTIPGFNVILFIMRPERFSEEMVKTVEIFSEFFGGKVGDFGYLVLTFTRNIDDRDGYLNGDKENFVNRHPKLDELLQRCKHKVLIIDNRDGEPSVEDQVQVIYERIIEETRKQNQPYFTNECIKHMVFFADDYITSRGKWKRLAMFTPTVLEWDRKPKKEDEDEVNSRSIYNPSHQEMYQSNYNNFKNDVENNPTLLDHIADFLFERFGGFFRMAARKVTDFFGSLFGYRS